MNPTFLLSVALLMSRISVFQATVRCPTAEYSIGGMFLRGHTFKTTKVGWPGGCHLMCEEELKCQSYNFVIGHKVCELNNRTKEARPEDFKPHQGRFYMKRARNRGTLQYSSPCLSPFKMQPFEMLACVSCRILPASTLFEIEVSNESCEATRRIRRNIAEFFPSWLQHSIPQLSRLVLSTIQESN